MHERTLLYEGSSLHKDILAQKVSFAQVTILHEIKIKIQKQNNDKVKD